MVRRVAALVLCVAAALWAPSARADAPKPVVVFQCDRASGPGRVRCGVEAKVASGEIIRWGDVEILQMPDFAQPLKGRIGPREASSHEDTVWRWGLAVVARRAGTGNVVLRVRLVVCADNDRCAPQVVEAQTVLQVG